MLCQSEHSVPVARLGAPLSATAKTSPLLPPEQEETSLFPHSLRETPQAEVTISSLMFLFLCILQA